MELRLASGWSFFLILSAMLAVASQTHAAQPGAEQCAAVCDERFGAQSGYRGLEDLPVSVYEWCNGSFGAGLAETEPCRSKALARRDMDLENCKVYLTEPCYGECEANYKQCTDAALEDFKNAKKQCVEEYVDKCHGWCLDRCQQKAECKVSIRKYADGVAADGVSNITVYVDVEGKYRDIGISVERKKGVYIPGQLILPDYATGRALPPKTSASFKPDEGNGIAEYLQMPEATFVAECTDEKGEKANATADFVVVQPPVFFIHGLWSSADTWAQFEKWAGQDGFEYADISYPASQDMRLDAPLLKEKLADLLDEVNEGKRYGGRKINAKKADVVAHSQGGLITRYYTKNGYENNIRKLVMLGTPNAGSAGASLIPSLFGLTGEAVRELEPKSKFLEEVNSGPNAKGIEHYTIAGTGWSTLKNSELGTFTWNGDGIVTAESVQLYGAEMYCTYDAHSTQVESRLFLTGIKSREAKNGGGVSLTASGRAYSLAKSILTTGTGLGGVECEVEETNSLRGIVRSPVTLHAYDGTGGHIGPSDGGIIENTIGDDADYSVEGGHPAITIYGDRKIRFVIAGEKEGEFGFSLISLGNGGKMSVKDFDGVKTDPNTRHMLDPDNLQLVKGEKNSAAPSGNAGQGADGGKGGAGSLGNGGQGAEGAGRQPAGGGNSPGLLGFLPYAAAAVLAVALAYLFLARGKK